MTTLPDLEPAALEAATSTLREIRDTKSSDRYVAKTVVNAYLAARSVPEAGKAVDAPTHRHLKTGHLVRVIGIGRMQMSTVPAQDMDDVVIYEHDGNLWVRAHWEFNDGRFAALPPPALASGAEPTAWRVRVNENGRIWYVYTERLPYTPDDHIKVLSEPEPLYVAQLDDAELLEATEAEVKRLLESPQAVPAEDVAGLVERLNASAISSDDNAASGGNVSFVDPRGAWAYDAALFREAAAVLTSLSAERDRLAKKVRAFRDDGLVQAAIERQGALQEERDDALARATASEAEATSLRRKLEEAERIGKMMANAIYNVHQRGLHVNADDMDSLKECQEAWDVAIAAAHLQEGTHHGR